MQLQKMLWVSFSLLIAGCGSIDRPDTDLCVVNDPGHHLICYNLKRDYDKNGSLKPGAVPMIKPIESIADLNKDVCTDPSGFEHLKTYVQEMKDAMKRCGCK